MSSAIESTTKDTTVATFELRHLAHDDGADMHRLARDGGGLDLNSPYAYVLGARTFGATSVAAVGPQGMAGFVLGLAPPEEPTTLFVWQVAVAPSARGRGLALSMLRWLVDTVAPAHLEATVTPGNTASRRLFGALAREIDAPLQRSRWAAHADLGDAEHEPEDLFRIGPIAR